MALGDSITLDMGEPMPDQTWRGWAALLASAMPNHDFPNLAISGALIRDVEHEQLPRALELRLAVVSVVAGVNDTLRRTFDPAAIAASLAHTVGALRAAGATVLTMRLPDPGRMFGLPGSLARPLARRIRAVNAICDAMAARFATLHFDVAGHPATYERRMWSVDRLHPSERGHAHPPGTGRLDGDQGHAVDGRPLPGPSAVPVQHDGRGVVVRAAGPRRAAGHHDRGADQGGADPRERAV